MHKLTRLVFWQNIVSHLQVPFIREVSKRFTGEVSIIVPEELSQERINLGWHVPEYTPAVLIINPMKDQIIDFINQKPTETCHIFSGVRAFKMVFLAYKHSLQVDTKRIIISESCDWRGIKGLMRLCIGKTDRIKWNRKIDAIYAIGKLGEQWFRKCGYPERKIIPFAYFVEPLESMEILKREDQIFHLIYIGQCIYRKGVDLLLNALSQINNIEWRLDIIGDGNKRKALERQVNNLNIKEKVRFLGVINNRDVMQILGKYDLLLLPSRRDGWGAVVNEALLLGVPVICSNLCGAADLISCEERGAVFKAGSVSSLKIALEIQFSLGLASIKRKQNIQRWANCIKPESGAVYFLQNLYALNTDKRNDPPWQ